jgi:hypothetical protein
MIVVKATLDSEAGKFPPEKEKMFAAMTAYHEELEKAGVLLDASGLQPSSKGWRDVKYTGGKRTVIDGPFIESKELIAGYTIIRVKSWKRRWRGPNVSPIPWVKGRKPKLRRASCTSWMT